MLTNKGKYGLKAMVHLAGLEPGSLAQAADIAEANTISKKFLDHILTDLCRAGLFIPEREKAAAMELAMLIPFALLAPIAQALPRGHVWPALIPLPLTALLINKFARDAGRGFNRILVQTVQIQSLFSLLLAVGVAL